MKPDFLTSLTVVHSIYGDTDTFLDIDGTYCLIFRGVRHPEETLSVIIFSNGEIMTVEDFPREVILTEFDLVHGR